MLQISGLCDELAELLHTSGVQDGVPCAGQNPSFVVLCSSRVPGLGLNFGFFGLSQGLGV